MLLFAFPLVLCPELPSFSCACLWFKEMQIPVTAHNPNLFACDVFVYKDFSHFFSQDNYKPKNMAFYPFIDYLL